MLLLLMTLLLQAGISWIEMTLLYWMAAPRDEMKIMELALLLFVLWCHKEDAINLHSSVVHVLLLLQEDVEPYSKCVLTRVVHILKKHLKINTCLAHKIQQSTNFRSWILIAFLFSFRNILKDLWGFLFDATGKGVDICILEILWFGITRPTDPRGTWIFDYHLKGGCGR